MFPSGMIEYTWDSPLYISRSVRLYFSKILYSFVLRFFIFTNSVDPDEMQHYATLHQVFTICRSTHLRVYRIQRVNRVHVK